MDKFSWVHHARDLRLGIVTNVRRHPWLFLTVARIHPHTIRHTTATHLLRAGLEINTIRDWLGHVSLDTTNIYAEIDLETKAKALAACEVSEKRSQRKRWRKSASLMDFLRKL
jgi:integrase/recombinase XerD